MQRYFVLLPDGTWAGFFHRRDHAEQAAKRLYGQVVMGRDFSEEEITNA